MYTCIWWCHTCPVTTRIYAIQTEILAKLETLLCIIILLVHRNRPSFGGMGSVTLHLCYVLPGVLVFLWEVNQCSMYCLESFHGGVPIYVLLVGLACVWGTIIWSVVRIHTCSGTSMWCVGHSSLCVREGGGGEGGGGHYVMVLSCAGAVMTRLYTGGKMAIYVHSVFCTELITWKPDWNIWTGIYQYFFFCRFVVSYMMLEWFQRVSFYYFLVYLAHFVNRNGCQLLSSCPLIQIPVCC